ncbi:MAG: hypothetical protein K6T80_00145 [Firmicutes bacterium]|nr:hypothetical protein [Bacillota bacterium]
MIPPKKEKTGKTVVQSSSIDEEKGACSAVDADSCPKSGSPDDDSSDDDSVSC